MGDNKALRVVYMGTPDFAVATLEVLCDNFTVVGVVTRPDAPSGRGKTLYPSPVKAAALARGMVSGVDILETRTLRTPETQQIIRDWNPDITVVAAYGAIIPDEVLDIPRLGTINLHASLLPRWRGAAPIQRAVLAGDEATGVSVMKIVTQLDAGDYCDQTYLPIGNKTTAQLTCGLALQGASAVVPAINSIADGSVTWTAQDEEFVTYAAKVTKAEMYLAPQASALQNKLHVQASSDTAPARCEIAGKGVRILDATLVSGTELAGLELNEGQVLAHEGHLLLGCTDGAIAIAHIKPDGKKEMEAKAWATGLRGDNLTWRSL